MTTQKQRFPSFASTISVLGIILFCAWFLRVELELNDQKKRINALENVAETKPPPVVHTPVQSYQYDRSRRHADSVRTTTEPKGTADTMDQINQLLSQGKLKLCQSKGDTCSSGPPGPPGPPGPKGEKGSQGRRGQKRGTGNKGFRGIMGPLGLKGKAGPKWQKGDIGPAGMPGGKGDPGESFSAPVVVVSPTTLTVHEKGTASFQCSVSGNPKPAVVWSKLNNQSGISQSAVSEGKLLLRNVKASDSGTYRCSAANGMGKSQAQVQLIVKVRVSLRPAFYHAIEGGHVALPTCHVTGYPAPVITWRKSSGPLPQGRVKYNNNGLQILNVRKSDSDLYVCSAANLLGIVEKKTLLVVVSLPRFNVKPLAKVVAFVNGTLRLNCSATGNPQLVISWKRLAAQVPIGRSQQVNGELVIRNITMNDTGYYICTARSAGVPFDVETVAYVEVINPRDCSDLLESGHTQSGVYSVNPDGKGSFTVYCDMRTDGGGWTVFQRRQDGSEDFYRGWNDYKSGFGQLTGEFWLGNDNIHRLTAARPSSLRVELEDWRRVRKYAKYGRFNIGDEQEQYRLEVGSYSGTAGDSLAHHNIMGFSTKDRDNDGDSDSIHCALRFTGAWWYNSCQHSNLNGKYRVGGKIDWKGLRWYHFEETALSLKFTEMKLKPSP